MAADGLTPRDKDFSAWYGEVVHRAELAEHAPVRGCMVIRPYGFAIWENIQRLLDADFKRTGHQNAYFPLFIPESFMKKEEKHVEGFAPECAVVTHGGGKPLEEPLYVRPTSETIIWNTFARWISSWRDLPLKLNQWANVVRWEMRPRLFLRTTEFLWQEGHTAHELEEEAVDETLQMLGIYRDFAEKSLAMPVLSGRKSEAERFAGAVQTYCIEALVQDRKAIQAGTSHFLGQNFSKVFQVRYQGRQGDLEYPWSTSWGVSTRLVGAVIMMHGDDQGLRLPPPVAPIQVVIVPIWRSDEQAIASIEAANKLRDALAGRFRMHVDARGGDRPGAKFFHWELRGVPVRLELGPRDLAQRQVVLVRRDDGSKTPVGWDGLESAIDDALEGVRAALHRDALAFRERHTHHVTSYPELQRTLEDEGGFVHAPWCGKAACEARVKADTMATSRCLPMEDDHPHAPCVVCGAEARVTPVFAKAY